MFSSFMPDMVGIDLEPHDAVELTASVGFEGFDLRLNRFVDSVEGRGVELLADHMQRLNLRPGYASLVSGKLGVSEKEWRGHVADLPRRADIASRLGYRRATTVVLPFSEELTFEQNFDLHVQRTREACSVLTDYGIRFGLEYVSPATRWRGKPHAFVRDLAGLRELLAATQEPAAGIMLDSFHWACANEGVEDILALTADDVIAVHVNDLVAGRSLDEQTVMERELPGTTGSIQIEAFLGALDEIGYEGPVTAEPTHPRWNKTPANDAARATADSVNRVITAARRPDSNE